MIIIRKDGTVCPDSRILGYVGETESRTIEVSAPVVEGAEYRLYFDVGNENPYEVELVDEKYTVEGSLLATAGDVTVQWAAVVPEGDTYTEVMKSEKFTMSVKASIGGTPVAVPTYEMAIDKLDEIEAALGTIPDIDFVTTGSGANCLCDDGLYHARGGGGGGSDGIWLPVPTETASGVDISWVKSETEIPPATVTLTNGADGQNGQDGIDGQNGTDGADGQDGYSPTATVTKSGTVAAVTITDKNGTTTAEIHDGEQGAKGDIGATGATGATGPAGADGLTTSVNEIEQVDGNISIDLDNIPDGTSRKLSGLHTDANGIITRTIGDVTEYLNPPMAVGVEYRTTERYFGNPVYVKIFDFGALPNTAGKSIQYTPTTASRFKPIAVFGNTSAGGLVPCAGLMEIKVYCNTTSLFVTTVADLSNLTAQIAIKYTKTIE